MHIASLLFSYLEKCKYVMGKCVGDAVCGLLFSESFHNFFPLVKYLFLLKMHTEVHL
jgi:hypothetical protein